MSRAVQSQTLSLSEIDRGWHARLDGFLPAKIIDMHAHIWKKTFEVGARPDLRGAQWASKVAAQNSLEDLLGDYASLFPGKKVLPLLFGWPERFIHLEVNNRWVSEQAARHHLPALYLSVPETPPGVLEVEVSSGGFLGLKPYLEFAPSHIHSNDITIYDFLPHAQLEAANAHGWIVMLHIPRSGRLKDPVNLAQMVEIERRYPNVQLVIAHLGRAYCEEDLGDALETLRRTERMMFDFSANTNSAVMQAFIDQLGSQRLVFGSDLPITHMRMRRFCEKGTYINLVPPGIYGDLRSDPQMREVSPDQARDITFFLYEELMAFMLAAQHARLSEAEIEAVFFGNARRLLDTAHKG